MRFGHSLKKVDESVVSLPSAVNPLFVLVSGVGPSPVEGTEPEELMDPVIEDYWSPSPHRVSVPDAEGESVVGVLDLGKITSEVLSRDVCFEVFRCRIYWDNPDFRPTICLPTEPRVGLLLPNIPPSVFPAPRCVILWSGRSVGPLSLVCLHLFL